MEIGTLRENGNGKRLARQIVDRYLKVVAETSHIVAGVPESMLPCDQSLIKEAIKEIIRQAPEGSDEYHRLRAAYPKLATFIPDDQAKRSAEAEAAVASMDMASEGSSISMSTPKSCAGFKTTCTCSPKNSMSF